jgi:hypothetical protein
MIPFGEHSIPFYGGYFVTGCAAKIKYWSSIYIDLSAGDIPAKESRKPSAHIFTKKYLKGNKSN